MNNREKARIARISKLRIIIKIYINDNFVG